MERALLLDENASEIDAVLEPAGSYGHVAGFSMFLRHMGLRLVAIWLVLVLLSYQVYLVEAKQLLAHPVDVFVGEIDMAVYSVTVEVLADLPLAHSFAELKPQVMRAGRLLGADPAEGLIDAEETGDGKFLRWVTTDRRGRQLKITGKALQEGQTMLLLELTERQIGKRAIKDQVVEVTTTAGRFGKIRATNLEVQGFVTAPIHGTPESWVQSWRLADLKTLRMGEAVKLLGNTPDLSQGRREPAAFTMVFVPDQNTQNGGRLTLAVKN